MCVQTPSFMFMTLVSSIIIIIIMVNYDSYLKIKKDSYDSFFKEK